MCEDTWRRLDADFDRIIGSLEVVARAGEPRAQGLRGDAVQPVWACGAGARHSAEAELNGLATDTGGTASVAALAGEGRADIGREGRANVYEFKRPGAVAPGKVSAQGYPEQGGKTLKTAKPGSARYAPARRANR